MDLEYRYSAAQNDGLTTQMKDWISGEEVTYQYDDLKRLVSAVTTGPEWGLSFSYDGFGNRTGQSVVKGSGPVSSLTYNLATNRLTGTGFGHDASGNVTGMPGPGPGCGMVLGYDALNRVYSVNAGSCGIEQYAYGPENRRVWERTVTGSVKEVVYLYGIGGEHRPGNRDLPTGGSLSRSQSIRGILLQHSLGQSASLPAFCSRPATCCESIAIESPCAVILSMAVYAVQFKPSAPVRASLQR